MATSLNVNIVTPGRELFSGSVSELLLPAHDGEAGVLPAHEPFVGLLGTGVLKVVQNSKDYWFVVSSGIYEVNNEKVTVLAEVGESSDEVDVESAKEQVSELEPKVAKSSSYDSEHQELKNSYDRAKARVEVYRRTNLVN